jgi:thiol-disulfide isomerase/thioredoxin
MVDGDGGAREELIVYGAPGDFGATLLFLGGRAATPLAGGGSAWADLEGGRVVRFSERGVVEAVLGGAPQTGGPLTQPGFVAMDGDVLLAVELDGRTLRFGEDGPLAWQAGPTPWGGVGGHGVIAASRTVFDIAIQPLMPTEPLVRTWDGVESRALGRITMPEQAMLAPVVNSGWVATSPAGDVYFASAVRPELQRFGADGELLWVATWEHDGAFEPTFGATGGTLTPRFRLTQQAVAVGPDGWIYVLATTGDDGPADRVLVFDDQGELARSAPLSAQGAIYVGKGGHVFGTTAEEALARTEASRSQMAFEPFSLPALDGNGTVELASHTGKVVVVNFWASWCGPCRREMPLLAEMAGRHSADDVVIVGLNEDLVPTDAIDFLAEIGGVDYPLAEGRGRLRDTYGYRGLPYTVVLGRDGRVVQALYGFGTSIEPIEEAVERALGGVD